jgi:hypothetical protein
MSPQCPAGIRCNISTGTTLHFTVTVTNNGPDAAQNLVVTDNFQAANFAGFTWPFPNSCTTTTPPRGGTIVCTAGSLDLGQHVTLTVTLKAACFHNQIMFNGASATSSTDDPNTSNNSASAGLYVC